MSQTYAALYITGWTRRDIVWGFLTAVVLHPITFAKATWRMRKYKKQGMPVEWIHVQRHPRNPW